jgi:hypothetical protein
LKDIVNINGKKNRNINKKKMIIAISIGVILLIIAITMLLYYSSRDVRNFLDQYLFRKNITQEKLNSIELDYNSNVNVFAYNKYICVLAENKLIEYNTSGNIVKEIELEISDPVYSVNNKYLAISEKNGSKINLISNSEILWTKDVDGQISKINVNENGYVSLIITGTTYKSVISLFDNKGNELFKTYLSTTTAIDTDVSDNNQYMAFAEVNTAGTTVQSNVKIVSIEKAKETPSEAITYTNESSSNKLILNIEYQGNDKVVCMYDDEITIMQNESNDNIMSLNEDGKNINFANINLNKNIYRTVEETEGFFNTNTVLEIKDIDSGKVTVTPIEGAAKYVYSNNEIIAVNLGQEIEFINTSGWLLKRYYSSQEIQNVIIGNKMAGIVYKDKVEIINL